MRRGFTIHHNGPPANCVGQPHSRCEAFWRAVRNYHVNTRGWSDIAYSFGMCPHGVLFTGRDWHRSQWANGTDEVGPNDGSDAVWYTVLAFIGGDELPTMAMIGGLAELINRGRATGRCGLRVTPHNDFKRKACPGPELTAVCRRWDGVAIGDEMSAQAEAILQKLDHFFFGGTDPAEASTYTRGAHSVLTTNHYVTQILAPQLAALEPNVSAQLDALAGAVRAVAERPVAQGGVPAPSVNEILDGLRDRLAA